MSTNVSAVQDYYDYADWYDNGEPTKPATEVIVPCDPTADDWLFHTSIAVISCIVMLILAAVTRWKQRHGGFRKDVAGLLSPVNFLEQTRHRGLAVAVFGVIFCKLCGLLLARSPLPFSKSQENKEYWKILGLFYYPALYSPLLACGGLRSQVGYALGSLLSWTHLGVLVWQKVDCPRTSEIYPYYSLLASLPLIVCLAFLSLLYPRLLFMALRSSREVSVSEDLDSSYYKDYVKEILQKRPTPDDSVTKTKLAERIFDALKSYISSPEEVFQLPLKLTISATVSCIAVYQVALLLVTAVVPTLQKVRAGVNEEVTYLLAGFNVILSQDRAEVIQIVVHYMWCVEVCYLSAMTLSCLATLVMLARSMVLHRSNLRGLYRGNVHNVLNRKRIARPSRQALVCWMGFTAYQAAVVCLGMVIQTLVFFICFLFAVFLVLIPILYGRNFMLFRFLRNMWPFWTTLLLITVLQHAASKFAFLKNDAGSRELVNRSGPFLMAYLLFPVNVLLGLVLGVWRIVITGLFNMVHLCRMDISLLSRGMEAFDPGYCCYSYYLMMEASQSHPVMKAFCGLLLCSVLGGGIPGLQLRDAEEGVRLVQKEKKPTLKSSARRAQARWLLLYTLVNNPALAASRKHFGCQSSESFLNGTLSRATKEGGDNGARRGASARGLAV
ncbi:receptor for retinol uptake stra6 [Paramormyrops kingsleyae]|uniref:receptor for retinol uptake stra6 n=1 Tax=Paramormyrops kingsleyae TaxID=1676925 RepID=UPI003B976496